MKYSLTIFIALFFFACGEGNKGEQNNNVNETASKENISLNDFDFMEGTWKDISETFLGFHEKWIKTDSMFQVIGFQIMEGDTMISEVISVKLHRGTLHYIPRVAKQNEGKEVFFSMSNESKKDSFAFVNYNHDFPQEIIYAKQKNGMVRVYLNGENLEDKKNVNFQLLLKKLD